MIKSLIINLIKKYLISTLNDLLEKYRYNVQVITSTISLWIVRLQKIVAELQKILERVSDGKIDDSETDDSISEIQQIVKNW